MKSRKNMLKGAKVLLIATILIFSNIVVLANTSYNNSNAITHHASANHLAVEKNSLLSAPLNVFAPIIEIKNVAGGFGKISAILNNIGSENATNVEWSISVKGGILGLINKETIGNITLIPVNSTGSVAIQTEKIIFGLGKVDITINATYAHSWVGTAVVFGPFILAINQTTFSAPEGMFEQMVKTNEETWRVTVRGNDYAVGIESITWTKDGHMIAGATYTEPIPGCNAGGEWSAEFKVPETPNDVHIRYKTQLHGQLNDVQFAGHNAPHTEEFGPPMPVGWQPLPPTQ